MKKLFTSLLLSTILVSAYASQHIITVSDFSYSPAQVNAVVGDTIIWQHNSGSHPTVSSNGAFAGFTISQSNPVHAMVFTATGNFPYHCVPHQAMGMVGNITVSAVSATPAFVKNVEVSVYPNPASDVITVAHNLERIDGIKITNMIGQQVRFVRPSSGQLHQLQVNIADLPKGMYMVNLQSNGNTVFTKRIVKDR